MVEAGERTMDVDQQSTYYVSSYYQSTSRKVRRRMEGSPTAAEDYELGTAVRRHPRSYPRLLVSPAGDVIASLRA